MEPTNEQLWDTLQHRLAEIQRRKELIPKIREGRKEAIIRSMQWTRVRNKPFSESHKKIEQSYHKARDEWQQLLKQYKDLVNREQGHLQKALIKVEHEIRQMTVVDLDLEDYKNAINASINGLAFEMKTVLKPLEPGETSSY